MPEPAEAVAFRARPRLAKSDDGPWWERAAELSTGSSKPVLAPRYFRFGDAVLEVAADSAHPLQELEARYGGCSVDATFGTASGRVCCSIRSFDEGRLAAVSLAGPGSIDAFGVASALLEHPVGAPLFVARGTSTDGWQLIATAQGGVPVVATRGNEALVDCTRAPRGFLVDLMVNPVLAIQRELLFVHAASVAIHGAGILVIGRTGSGKTTTALAIAARGHAYFGDDMAAIHTASAQLLAFRTTANLRPGPHASALSPHLESGCWDAPHSDGVRRLRLRVETVFPDAVATKPVVLRRAIFLRGFADAPALEPFVPAPGTLGPLALNNALWLAWGTTPQRRLLQFMVFVQMLARVPCAWLDLGPPEATADLIENTMEASWG